MELNQLKTFVTVAEEMHLTRAADRLYTSQPAISAQLKSLEEQLGHRLFDRTPKGMHLTPAGEQLLVSAQSTLASAEALLSEAKQLQGKVLGKLKIGVNSDFSFLRIPELLGRCREHHPGLKLSLVNSMSAQIIPDIRKGVLDSGFFFGPCSSADLNIHKLSDIKTAIVIPEAWSDDLCHAGIEKLATLPWVYTTKECPFYALKEALFESSSVKPEKDVFVDTEEGIRELIKAESGISLLREDDADKAESEGWGKRWLGSSPSVALQVAIHVNRTSEPEIVAWLEQINDCWKRNTELGIQSYGESA